MRTQLSELIILYNYFYPLFGCISMRKFASHYIQERIFFFSLFIVINVCMCSLFLWVFIETESNISIRNKRRNKTDKNRFKTLIYSNSKSASYWIKHIIYFLFNVIYIVFVTYWKFFFIILFLSFSTTNITVV